VPEKSEKKDDWNWNAKQPEKNSATHFGTPFNAIADANYCITF
jgi:hypothetical protein